MPMVPGNSACTTGLSKEIFDAIVADGRGLAPQTTARDEAIRGLAFSIATAVVSHITTNATVVGVQTGGGTAAIT